MNQYLFLITLTMLGIQNVSNAKTMNLTDCHTEHFLIVNRTICLNAKKERVEVDPGIFELTRLDGIKRKDIVTTECPENDNYHCRVTSKRGTFRGQVRREIGVRENTAFQSMTAP